MELINHTKESIDEVFNKTVEIFAAIPEVDMDRMQLQLEYARKIIDVYHSGIKNVVLSAPTGFGKSLMAFFLAKFMRELDGGNQTYIMTSNKFLQKQYRRDIIEFKFNPKFALLSGQANYKCTINDLPFTQRVCKDKSISSVEKPGSGYGCAQDCAYLLARRRAQHAEGTVLNYNYWLTTMNHVYAANPSSKFGIRALSIFDESHVMGNIVQDMFSVDFNPTSFIRQTFNHMTVLKSRLFDDESPTITFDDFKEIIDLSVRIKNLQDSQEELMPVIKEFIEELIIIRNTYNGKLVQLVKRLPTNPDGSAIKNAEDKKLIAYSAGLIDKIQRLSDMYEIYQNLGSDTIVIQHEFQDPKIVKPIPEFGKDGMETIKFQCTSERELIQKSVHEFTDNALFMSATLGNVDDYAKQIGLEDGEYVTFEIPQVFDFKESPIYKVDPMISMAYRNKVENTPMMLDRIKKILDHHQNDRGLIHTGNFQLMKELESLNNPRIKTYTNSTEKEEIIKLLGSQSNAVVCGPSLVEGVDLKNDLCRFMIFMKVPYLSLGDKLIKRKMEIYENWYNWNTLCSFLQGLGRPIRNKTDWCTTYLLDESFESFFRRYAPPQWIQNRIKNMKGNNIGVEYNPETEYEDLLKF